MPLFRGSIKEISREDVLKKIVPELIQKLTGHYAVYEAWRSAIPEISERLDAIAERIRLLKSLQQPRVCLSLDQLQYLLESPLFKGGHEFQNMAKAIIYHYGIPALQLECLRRIKLAELDIGADCRAEFKPVLETLDKIKNAVAIEREEYGILLGSKRFQEILKPLKWVQWLATQKVIIKEVKGPLTVQTVFLAEGERARADSAASTASLAEPRSARSSSAASDCSYGNE
ncbi:MAG: hypothetical protein K0R66_1591 [Gammaproteobacteria bacterium]|jgi:hypothetical protein|nr:hypothetical protein [Gammaproteobacteria bacterium]